MHSSPLILPGHLPLRETGVRVDTLGRYLGPPAKAGVRSKQGAVQQGNNIYYLDPLVATGFIYTIGVGDPNFASVLLPDLQGSEPYTITWDNGLDTATVLGGNPFDFLLTDPLGVSTFTVT